MDTIDVGLRHWRGKLSGNFVFKIQIPLISAPVECPARSCLTRSIFLRHHSLKHFSHGRLCCSIVAFLALIFCEVLLLPMRSGGESVARQTRVSRREHQKQSSKTGVQPFGLSKWEICVKFSVL